MFAARRIAQLGKINNDGFYMYGSVETIFRRPGWGETALVELKGSEL